MIVRPTPLQAMLWQTGDSHEHLGQLITVPQESSCARSTSSRPASSSSRAPRAQAPESHSHSATHGLGEMQTEDKAAAVTGLQAEHLALQTAPVGPPYVLRTQELLGEALSGSGRAPEAVRAYERALELTPLRSSALLGLARARAAAGDSAGARHAYAQLLRNWQHADDGIPGLDEARRAVASH
jgi:hypothetical protein